MIIWYKLAFFTSFISILIPYFISQGSLIGTKFNRGDYEAKNKGFCKKIVDNFLMTFFGMLLVFALEVIEIFGRILGVLDLITGLELIEDSVMSLKVCLTGLTSYEIECYENSKKITTLFFENST